MKQREKIAWYVARGELIDSPHLDCAYKEFAGSNDFVSRVEKAEWLLNHVPMTELSCIIEFEFIRVCDHCGKPMGWGYVIDNGREHYCDDECLNHHYTRGEFLELYDDGKGDSYYAAWID